MCQRFLYNQERHFSLIRQKTKIFHIDPHYKNRQLLSIDMTLQKWAIFIMGVDMTLQKWATFIMGVYGENICLLSDPAEISFLVTRLYKKR